MLSILLTIQSEYGIRRPIDDSLIEKISLGDMDAFRELYEITSKSVYGFALSILKNSQDAEDVLQETFLKVYSNASDYVPHGKPMAWILRIARNLSMTKLREKTKNTEYNEVAGEEIDLSSLHDAEKRLLIENLFKILSDEEKQILVLHAVGGMKHREIAKLMDIALNTVLSKYHRAIRKLKLSMEE